MRILFSIVLLGLFSSIAAQEVSCFKLVYPLTFDASDGSTIEVKDEEAMDVYKASWKEQGSYPTLSFPIEVKWAGKEDAMPIEDKDELGRHWARCLAKEKPKSGSEKCFSLVYPVVFTVNGDKVEIVSLEEMANYRKVWEGQKIRPEINYPLEIKWEGEDPITVNSNEEMKSWKMACRGL